MTLLENLRVPSGPIVEGHDVYRVGERDIRHRLPASAVVKLDALHERGEILTAVARLPYEQMRDATTARQENAARLKNLITPKAAGGFGAPVGHPERERREAAEADYAREIARLRPIIDARNARAQVAAQLLRRINDYIEQIPAATPITEHGPVHVDLKKQDIADAIEARRRRVRELRADLKQIDAAPIPSGKARELAAAQVVALAEKGAPDVLNIVETGKGEIRWPTIRREVFYRGATNPEVLVLENIDTPALFAWVFRDTLIAAINREIGELADDANALTTPERERRTREVLADLLATEREEEHLITLAAERGTEIDRRSDADPRAALGLSGDLPAPT
jgi:hypothetical protein